MTHHRLRPAPLRAARTWRLEGTVLAEGETTLDLAKVTRAVFVDMGPDRAPIRRLDLFGPDGRWRIGVNASGGALAMAEDLAAFRDLCTGIARALDRARPGFTAELGEYGAARWGLFAVALASGLAGVALPALAVASGVQGDRIVAAVLPSALLLGIGAVVGWSSWPGRARPLISMTDLEELIARR